jgi:hypothetical protein
MPDAIGEIGSELDSSEDIQPESGPLVYYPGSHKTEISDFFDWGEGSILFEQTVSVSPTNYQFIWLSG